MTSKYLDSENNEVNCPNYDSETGILDKSWSKWSETDDTLRNNLSYNQSCYDICGPRNYIQIIGNTPMCSEDLSCPDISLRGTDTGRIEYDEKIEDLGELGDMCSITPNGGSLEVDTPFTEGGYFVETRRTWDETGEADVPEWFINQKDANLSMEYLGDINWEKFSTPSSDGNQIQYWKQAERKISDNEIRGLMGGIMTMQLMSPTVDPAYSRDADDGQYYYNFPEGYTDMETLRSDINKGRGDKVACWDDTRGDWMTECSGENPATTEAPTDVSESHFGPDDIVAEEVRDFKNFLENKKMIQRGKSGNEKTQEDRLSLMGILGDSAANPLFEECMNEIFETDFIPSMYDTEIEVMSDIKNMSSIDNLTDEHIKYIRLKLKKIAQTNVTDAMDCMDKLNIGESICRTGISDKIIMASSLVISMMGMNNLDVSKIERGTTQYRKLNRLINELGYLLPQAFKKIIEISQMYEEQYCGSVTTSTMALNEVYDKLYTDNREVKIDFTPSFDINSFIDNDPIMFLQKVGVVLLVAYCITMILRAFREVKQVVE